MTAFKKALLGTMFAVAFAAPAMAQTSDPWDTRASMAYVVDPAGKMRILPIGDKGMAMLTKHAKPVSKGTVFFMHNGQLYAMQGGAFDRAGGWMLSF